MSHISEYEVENILIDRLESIGYSFITVSYTHLFEGLSIWKQEKYRRLQGTYPVIFLSFADVKQNNYHDAVQKIKNIIVDAYRRHRYLEQEECFTQNEKQQMLEITEKMSDVTAQDALKNLSSYLNLLYGKKVLIFLVILYKINKKLCDMYEDC